MLKYLNHAVVISFLLFSACSGSLSVDQAIQSIKEYNFEKNSGYDGVGNLDDGAWKVRIIAIKNILLNGEKGVVKLRQYLKDENRHVRHVAALSLGLLKAESAAEDLENLLRDDPDPIVRGQAAEALGQIGLPDARQVLSAAAEADTNRNVMHRCKLALGALDFTSPGYGQHADAFRGLDENKFELIEVGNPALPFSLKDTKGNAYSLEEALESHDWLVLIWIFADWCPVCQHEFNDLQELEEEYREENVQVMTIECRELYRCDAMVAGRDLWWPHLVDNGGVLGATYGVDPMTFWVHDEWVNRPSTVIIDKEGIVRFAYYGTFWGDRPSIDETLEFIRSGNFEFEHPKRRK